MQVYAQDKLWDVGLDINADCLQDGSCGWDLEKTLGIRQEIENRNDENLFEILTKDVFLSATFFIGTVITFALVYSGLLIVLWWASETTVQKGKDWVKRSLVWLVLVVFSYTIIKGIQFIAQG